MVARVTSWALALLDFMIVCSCNVITDEAVRTACRTRAPRTTGQVYGCLGCSAQCGRCARSIRKIMDDALMAAKQGCPVGCSCCAHSISAAGTEKAQ